MKAETRRSWGEEYDHSDPNNGGGDALGRKGVFTVSRADEDHLKEVLDQVPPFQQWSVKSTDDTGVCVGGKAKRAGCMIRENMDRVTPLWQGDGGRGIRLESVLIEDVRVENCSTCDATSFFTSP